MTAALLSLIFTYFLWVWADPLMKLVKARTEELERENRWVGSDPIQPFKTSGTLDK